MERYGKTWTTLMELLLVMTMKMKAANSFSLVTHSLTAELQKEVFLLYYFPFGSARQEGQESFEWIVQPKFSRRGSMGNSSFAVRSHRPQHGGAACDPTDTCYRIPPQKERGRDGARGKTRRLGSVLIKEENNSTINSKNPCEILLTAHTSHLVAI
ncbi:hypothetical protein F2P79_007080 [Pimephales promelas]|nr:hypothetical protein F2P79_007080 [Pimephales promelas]